MSVFHRCGARAGLVVLACAALVSCGNFDGASRRIAGIITPYKVEVVQGNFVSKEQVEALRPGMSRNEVKSVLGTPLLASAFHADRWDYVFTLRRQGVPLQSRRLTVFFKNDALERFEGDEMPSEAEFVGSLESGRSKGKVPQLEASEESLKKYPAPVPKEPPAPPPAPASYPPLEPASR